MMYFVAFVKRRLSMETPRFPYPLDHRDALDFNLPPIYLNDKIDRLILLA